MIELRVLALVGLLAVMIGMTLLIGVAMAVTERLRLGLSRAFDADKGAGDSPGRERIQKSCPAIRIAGGEIR